MRIRLQAWGLTAVVCWLASPVMRAAEAPASIIPKPDSLTTLPGAFRLSAKTVIVCEEASRPVGEMLSTMLAPATGFRLQVVRGNRARNNSIVLRVDSGASALGEEGYSLAIDSGHVEIRASALAGVFYGAQTLRQLLPPEIYSSALAKGVSWSVPCLRVEDRPRLAWRGALIDVARHYMPKSALLKFIDVMASQKLNHLQLHLTDDQGWRIEIKKYPRLTEIGSIRKETRLGHEREKKGFDGKPHSGFYSQQDIREIVAHARRHFINVVPEIEMPGHATAAVAAYPHLGNTGKQLEVGTTWGVYKDVFNVEEKTLLFLQDVLTEVLELFPSKFIHVGGDEVPKDQWKASARMQARIRELGLKDEAELQSYFIRRMDQFLTQRGRRLIGWDEILEGGLAPGATVMSWRGIAGGVTAARAGHDVVMAPTTHTYLDYYQAKSPREPLAIGGFLPLERVYSFEPVPAEITPDQAKHIIGVQGQLWSEYIPTPSHLEYMAFPRLAAIAEVGWTAARQKDYASFSQRLKVQEARWKAQGVNFRPSGE